MRFRFRMMLVTVFAFAGLFAAAPTAPENYKMHCNQCHGPDGKSQTRLGRKSGAKDLSDKAAMAKLSDDEVAIASFARFTTARAAASCRGI